MAEYKNLIEIVILICIFFIINVFVLYPLILAIASKIFSKPIKTSNEFKPEISIIIAAYNEEELIKDAIISIYDSDYPNELINVFVGSDGSSDRTVEIVNELQNQYPNLFCYEYERSGKNDVLNQLVPKAKTDIIFYMDADIRVEKNTISEIIAYFNDENVGSIIASMLSVDEIGNDNSGRQGETSYQKYEKNLRIYESEISSTINSLGAFYGLKKDYYSPLPNEFVCDDLYPLYKVIANGKRVFFNSKINVKEVRKKSLNIEFSRRVRVAAGGLATVWACKELLSPKYGWVSFFVWNHKLLRWFSPIYLIIIAVGTILLSPDSYLFYPLIILQGILYFGAIIGWILEKLKINFLPFKLLLFIVSMNIGFLFGIFRFLFKGQNAKWG